MKTKLFLLLMAAVLLLSVNVSAQSSKKTTPKKTESETPLKGDVNGDGKVDVADIVAILKIMKETGGTSETTYYWYVGQDNPLSMSSITPLPSNAASEGAGWRTIGSQSDLESISSSNKLWDGSRIETGDTKQTNYVALPNSTLYMYDSAGNISRALWGNSIGTVVFNGVTYYIYSSVANLKAFSNNIY